MATNSGAEEEEEEEAVRKRHNSVGVDLQVGEVVSPLKSGRLDARYLILPEVQVLQLGQLLEQAVRFDLVQFIVAQQSGVSTST